MIGAPKIENDNDHNPFRIGWDLLCTKFEVLSAPIMEIAKAKQKAENR